MAYKKDELEAQALDAITRHNLFFIEDVVSYLPCSRATFYNKNLDKLDTIKESLDQNKIRTKNGLRSKWFKDGNATTQIALYKLLASEDELKRLGSQYIDHTTGGDKIQAAPITFSGPAKDIDLDCDE